MGACVLGTEQWQDLVLGDICIKTGFIPRGDGRTEFFNPDIARIEVRIRFKNELTQLVEVHGARRDVGTPDTEVFYFPSGLFFDFSYYSVEPRENIFRKLLKPLCGYKTFHGYFFCSAFEDVCISSKMFRINSEESPMYVPHAMRLLSTSLQRFSSTTGSPSSSFRSPIFLTELILSANAANSFLSAISM